MRPALLLSLLSLIALVSLVSAEELSPKAVPAIGSIAPAFGLYLLAGDDDERGEAVQLDSVCGLRPGESKGVLLLFTDAQHVSGLEIANGLYRKFHKEGLEVLAVAVDKKPIVLRSKVEKLRLRFPVLDDRFGIVASRYGLAAAPFSILMNSECRILGFSNKTLAAEQEALSGSIEALVNEQIGARSGSMDD